jgi:Family of unknown function (DUF6176)
LSGSDSSTGAPRRIRVGKAGRVGDWMRFLEAHEREAVESLEREHMYVEGIFRDRVNGTEVVYWLPVPGAGGKSDFDSPMAIDKEHLKFLREVMKKGGQTELAVESSLIAPFILDTIRAH